MKSIVGNLYLASIVSSATNGQRQLLETIWVLNKSTLHACKCHSDLIIDIKTVSFNDIREYHRTV